MNQLLNIDKQITTTAGNIIKIESYLGGGGQGEVYKVGYQGKKFALKWYYPKTATQDQLKILEALVSIGPPNDKFLWPLELIKCPEIKGFGYLMPLRDSTYKSINDLMTKKVNPSFKTISKIGYHLADSFLQIHSKGLSYRDISFGNVFFDPIKGDVLICDNDNVAVDSTTPATILGTPRFMAPEIVIGKASASKYTDLFSLSVLLFYIFFVHHPLDGEMESKIKCLDLPAMNKIYGSEPIFIFDPLNSSNRPVPGLHDNAIIFWNIYPQFFKDLFIKAFTEGLTDPQNGRVAESIWRLNMIRLNDSIIYCQKCSNENFYDNEKLKNSTSHVCWYCKTKTEIQLPPRISIGNMTIMLNFDTKLYPHHLGDYYNFTTPVGEVTQHPKNPKIWGIKNLTKDNWSLTKPDGTIAEIGLGKSASLAIGNKINFGKVIGEINF